MHKINARPGLLAINAFFCTMTPLTCTLIQTALHWENKEANLQMFEQKINSLQEKPHVIILPEMFSTGFSMKPEALAETMEGPSVQWMKRTAAEKRAIITGSLIIEEEGHYFNRLIWMLPNGTYGYYNKRHLFAFAGEDQHYTPGTQRLVASVNGWRVNLQVCYDLRFPVWARQSGTPVEEERTSPEYDVLVYVANWPERRNHAWKTLLQARAIENQCYVIGVNRVGEDGNGIYHSGDSMVADPMGAVLYHKAHDEVIHTLTLDPQQLHDVRQKFPFWKDADGFDIYP
jgi:omega-amidase